MSRRIFGRALEGSGNRSRIRRRKERLWEPFPSSVRHSKSLRAVRRFYGTLEDSEKRSNLLRGVPTLCKPPEASEAYWKSLQGAEIFQEALPNSENRPEALWRAPRFDERLESSGRRDGDLRASRKFCDAYEKPKRDRILEQPPPLLRLLATGLSRPVGAQEYSLAFQRQGSAPTISQSPEGTPAQARLMEARRLRERTWTSPPARSLWGMARAAKTGAPCVRTTMIYTHGLSSGGQGFEPSGLSLALAEA
jgi:hypothetical protein